LLLIGSHNGILTSYDPESVVGAKNDPAQKESTDRTI
jgi:hypothetical protein